MKGNRFLSIGILILSFLTLIYFSPAVAQTLKERNEVLFEQIQRIHGLSDKQIVSIETIFRESGYIGQGNPAITEHPLTQRPDRKRSASWPFDMRIRNLREFVVQSTWRPFIIRLPKGRKMPGLASISSSFPTSPVSTRLSGYGPVKPL